MSINIHLLGVRGGARVKCLAQRLAECEFDVGEECVSKNEASECETRLVKNTSCGHQRVREKGSALGHFPLASMAEGACAGCRGHEKGARDIIET